MAFGPHLLGYACAEVDDAAISQLRRGTPLSMNHPLHVRFIERLVGRFPGAEMGIFFRSGSEATTVREHAVLTDTNGLHVDVYMTAVTADHRARI